MKLKTKVVCRTIEETRWGHTWEFAGNAGNFVKVSISSDDYKGPAPVVGKGYYLELSSDECDGLKEKKKM